MEWEIVIGLEIHVQLATKSKIFSGSSTAFGAEPNTQANVVDLAMPGALPVFNETALKMAVQFGLAIGAEIGKKSVFDRKNYFYPDSPKGYQISQMHYPIVGVGEVDVRLSEDVTKRIGVTRAHLEEDAGKSLHERFAGQSGIDLNRAGTPLLEIVSEPDLRSAKEAVAYLKKMHSIITYLGISDGNMSQGSMRCDANVSLRPFGQTEFGTRTELKNINSFRFVEKAINVEVERQRDILEDGGRITQETRLYDSEKNETRPMRSKEVANDYRYFPEPDLLPIIIDDDYIQQLKDNLPELPDEKCARFVSEYSLSDYDASILSASRSIAEYFDAVVKASDEPKLSANWVMGELMGRLNKNDTDIVDSPVDANALGLMIKRISDKTINGKIAKEVFELMWNERRTPDEIIETEGLKPADDSEVITIINDVINNNPQQVDNYKNAPDNKKQKMFGFFVGQVMKASKGKADPQQVNKILKEKLI